MAAASSGTLTVREIVRALHRQTQCDAPEAFKQLAGAVIRANINPTHGGADFISPDARQFASRLIEAADCCRFAGDQIRCYSTGGLMLMAQPTTGKHLALDLLEMEIRKRDLHGASTKHGFPYAPEWSNLTDDDRRKGRQRDTAASERRRLINHVVQQLKAEGNTVTAQRVVSTLVDSARWKKLLPLGVENAKPGSKPDSVVITWKNGGDDRVAPSTLRGCIRDAKVAAGIRVKNRAS